MHNTAAVLLFLIVLGQVSSADDGPPIASSDSRFQVIQRAEADYKPGKLPRGTENDQLAFYQHRLGSADTPPLALAMSKDGQHVWYDAARNGTWKELTRSERTSSNSRLSEKKTWPIWSGKVQSQVAASRVELWPAPEAIDIHLRYDAKTNLWLLATLLQVDGQFDIDSQTVLYRLRDENSDGQLDDSDDSLQVDLNGNGKFEVLRESFRLNRFFRYQGKRYTLKLDRAARTIGVYSVEETGTAQLTFEGWDALLQPPSRIHVCLQSDSGVQAFFDSTEPQSIPTGDYSIFAASLMWDGDEKWRMTFSHEDGLPLKKYKIEPNQETKISVLGKAELTAEIERHSFANNQWHLTVQPVLRTESGLYLTRSSSGRLEPTVDGTLIASVQAAEGNRPLTSGSTQFACGTFCPINMVWKNETAQRVKLTFDTGPLAGVITSEIDIEKKKP